jgi:hypothetical protein
MSIVEMAEQVKSKEDFVNFLQVLIADFSNNKEEWENPELGRYLEAMEGFLQDSTEKSINKIDFTPSWSLFARIMVAASIYE